MIVSAIFLCCVLIGIFFFLKRWSWNPSALEYVALSFYLIFIVFAPFGARYAMVTAQQKNFCYALYVVLLIGGIVIMFFMHGHEDEDGETHKVKDPGAAVREVVAANASEKRAYNLMVAIYALLLSVLNLMAFASRMDGNLIYNVLNTLEVVPMYIYAIAASILFCISERIWKEDGYKNASVLFSLGAIVYSFSIPKVKQECMERFQIEFEGWIFVYMYIILLFWIFCWYKTRKKSSLRLTGIFCVAGVMPFLPNVDYYIGSALSVLSKFWSDVLKAPAFGGTAVVAITAFLTWVGGIWGSDGNLYIDMYVLDRKKLKGMGWSDPSGESYAGEKILGLYGFHYSYRDFLPVDKLPEALKEVVECEIYENKLPENERVVIETDDMKIWEYAIETDQGWYYVDDEGKIEEWGKNTKPWLYWKGKNIPWSDERCKDIKAYDGLQLLILSEKDWEFLEKDSFYVKKYRKKYKGKYKYPIYLDNPKLQ